MRQIAITNISTVVNDDDVKAAVLALQTQVSVDFAAIWGIDAKLFFLDKATKPDIGIAQIIVADNSDQAGALGYHEMTVNGDPLGYCFAKTDLDAGYSWTNTLSHELLELLADPQINQVAEVDHQDGSITFYAYEVCDACEDDSYGYNVKDKNGNLLLLPSNSKPILVSDFVTPEFFMSPAPPNVGFDVRGHIMAPLQILQGGYLSILQLNNPGQGWQQVTAEKNTGRAIPGGKEPHVGSRRMRRRMPDAFWRKSSR